MTILSRTVRLGDCFIWQGATQSRGYGVVTGGRKGLTKLAHRVVYEAEVAPIPEGMTVDHLCRQKLCLNVAHMEVVTRGENSRRGNAAVTHCPAGHEYTPENTYYKPAVYGTARQCRTCGRDRARERAIAEATEAVAS